MTEWTSAKLASFIRDVLDKQPGLEVRANFRVRTGVIVKQGCKEYTIVVEPK